MPVTAEDVRWTWQAQTQSRRRLGSSPTRSAGSPTSRWWTRTPSASTSTRVYAKQLLDANEGAIFPKHAWEKLPFAQWRQSGDWFRQHLVVDGPFTIASWTAAAGDRPAAQRALLTRRGSPTSTAS